MRKAKIEYPIYKPGNIKIGEKDYYKDPHINYDYVQRDEYDILRDIIHPEIKYFHPYVNKNERCLGEEYYVVKVFKTKDVDEDSRRIMVQVQFVPTRTLLTVTFRMFLTENLYDPYYKFLYNGTCCYGNVNIGAMEYSAELIFWDRYMSRIFDPSDVEYKDYGGLGLKPVFIEWTCFEYYLLFNRIRVADGLLPILDPNDPYLYFRSDSNSRNDGIKTSDIRSIVAYRSPIEYNYIVMPRYIRELPLTERRIDVLTNRNKVGRPAGSISKPKPKPKFQMMRVVNPNADLLFEERMRRNIINTTIE